MAITSIHSEQIGEHAEIILVEITEPGQSPRREWEMICSFCDESCTGLSYSEAENEANKHHHDGTEGEPDDAVS